MYGANADQVEGQELAAVLWRANESCADLVAGETTRRAARQRYAGWVYVVEIEGQEGYKIGLSRSPEQRMMSLARQFVAARVRLLHLIASLDASWVERTLHRRFAGKRINGEFFALEAEDLAWLKQIARLDPPGAAPWAEFVLPAGELAALQAKRREHERLAREQEQKRIEEEGIAHQRRITKGLLAAAENCQRPLYDVQVDEEWCTPEDRANLNMLALDKTQRWWGTRGRGDAENADEYMVLVRERNRREWWRQVFRDGAGEERERNRSALTSAEAGTA